MWFWVKAAWDFIFGWAGVDMLVGFACIAVAAFETWIIGALGPLGRFVPDLRKWALAAAVVAFTLTGAIGYGYKNGVSFTKSEWVAAQRQEITDGERIHDEAVRDSRSDTPDVVRNDSWNRDNWKHGNRP